MQRLLLDVIQEAAPEAYAKRTKRLGIVNAWMDENFAQAVRDTGECSRNYRSGDNAYRSPDISLQSNCIVENRL
jgi:hypothetical protein